MKKVLFQKTIAIFLSLVMCVFSVPVMPGTAHASEAVATQAQDGSGRRIPVLPMPPEGFPIPEEELENLPTGGDLWDGIAENERVCEPLCAPERADVEDLPSQYERVDFEDAMDQVREEYAVAMVVDVESINSDNLEDLVDQDAEAALVVLDGEVVLFSSGHNTDVRVTEQADEILQDSDFVLHTHLAHSSDTSSDFDKDEILEGLDAEYLLSSDGAYKYTDDSDERVSYAEVEAAIKIALEKSELNSSEAREKLNRFIANADRIQSGEEVVVFRAAGDPVSTRTDGKKDLNVSYDGTTLTMVWGNNTYKKQVTEEELATGKVTLPGKSAAQHTQEFTLEFEATTVDGRTIISINAMEVKTDYDYNDYQYINKQRYIFGENGELAGMEYEYDREGYISKSSNFYTYVEIGGKQFIKTMVSESEYTYVDQNGNEVKNKYSNDMTYDYDEKGNRVGYEYSNSGTNNGQPYKSTGKQLLEYVEVNGQWKVVNSINESSYTYTDENGNEQTTISKNNYSHEYDANGNYKKYSYENERTQNGITTRTSGVTDRDYVRLNGRWYAKSYNSTTTTSYEKEGVTYTRVETSESTYDYRVVNNQVRNFGTTTLSEATYDGEDGEQHTEVRSSRNFYKYSSSGHYIASLHVNETVIDGDEVQGSASYSIQDSENKQRLSASVSNLNVSIYEDINSVDDYGVIDEVADRKTVQKYSHSSLEWKYHTKTVQYYKEDGVMVARYVQPKGSEVVYAVRGDEEDTSHPVKNYQLVEMEGVNYSVRFGEGYKYNYQMYDSDYYAQPRWGDLYGYSENLGVGLVVEVWEGNEHWIVVVDYPPAQDVVPTVTLKDGKQYEITVNESGEVNFELKSEVRTILNEETGLREKEIIEVRDEDGNLIERIVKKYDESGENVVRESNQTEFVDVGEPPVRKWMNNVTTIFDAETGNMKREVEVVRDDEGRVTERHIKKYDETGENVVQEIIQTDFVDVGDPPKRKWTSQEVAMIDAETGKLKREVSVTRGEDGKIQDKHIKHYGEDGETVVKEVMVSDYEEVGDPPKMKWHTRMIFDETDDGKRKRVQTRDFHENGVRKQIITEVYEGDEEGDWDLVDTITKDYDEEGNLIVPEPEDPEDNVEQLKQQVADELQAAIVAAELALADLESVKQEIKTAVTATVTAIDASIELSVSDLRALEVELSFLSGETEVDPNTKGLLDEQYANISNFLGDLELSAMTYFEKYEAKKLENIELKIAAQQDYIRDLKQYVTDNQQGIVDATTTEELEAIRSGMPTVDLPDPPEPEMPGGDPRIGLDESVEDLVNAAQVVVQQARDELAGLPEKMEKAEELIAAIKKALVDSNTGDLNGDGKTSQADAIYAANRYADAIEVLDHLSEEDKAILNFNDDEVINMADQEAVMAVILEIAESNAAETMVAEAIQELAEATGVDPDKISLFEVIDVSNTGGPWSPGKHPGGPIGMVEWFGKEVQLKIEGIEHVFRLRGGQIETFSGSALELTLAALDEASLEEGAVLKSIEQQNGEFVDLFNDPVVYRVTWEADGEEFVYEYTYKYEASQDVLSLGSYTEKVELIESDIQTRLLDQVNTLIAEVDTAIAVLEGDKETATTDINKDIKDIEDDIAVKKSSLGLMVAGLEELKGEAGVKPETITDMEKLIEALEADIEALGETAALFSAMRLNATGPIQTDIDELKALRADYVGHRGDIEDADSLTRLEELEGMLFEKPEIGFDPAPTNGLDPRDDVDVEARQTQVDVLVDKANKEIDEAIERAELIAYFDEVEELANGVMAVIQDEYGAILGMSLGVSEEELEGAIIELGLGDADAERLRNMRLYYGVVQTAAEAFVTLDGELFDTRYPGLRDPLTGEFNDDFKAFIESEGLPDLKGVSVLAVAVDNDAPIEDLRAKAEEMKAIVGEDAEAYFMAKQAEVVADIRDKEDALEGIKEELMQTLVDAEAAALAAAIAAKKAELTAEVDQKIAEVDTAIAVLEGDKETATTDINKDIKDIEDDIAVKKSSLGLMVAGLEELKGEAGVKPETITDMEKLIEALEADIEALGETAALFSAMRLNATGPIQTDIDELKALRADYVGHRGDIEDADSLTRLEELEGMLFEKPEIGFDPAPTNGLDPRDDVDVEARQTQVDVLVDKANKEIDEAIERAELIAYFDEVEELANGVMAVIQDEYGAILGMSLGVSEEELEGAIIELGLGDADAERLRNMRLYYGVVQTAAEAFVTLDGELFDTRYPGLRDPLTGEFNDDFKAFIESEGLPDLKGVSVLAVAVDNDAPIEDLRAKAEEMKAIVGEDAEAYFMAKQAEVVADIRDKEDALEGIKEELMQTLVDAEAAALAAAIAAKKAELTAEVDQKIAEVDTAIAVLEGDKETATTDINKDIKDIEDDIAVKKSSLGLMVAGLEELKGEAGVKPETITDMEKLIEALEADIEALGETAALFSAMRLNATGPIQTDIDELKALRADYVGHRGDIEDADSLTRLEELEGMLFEKPEIGFDPAPTNGLDPRDDVDVEARQTQVDVLVDKANKEIDEAIERAELIAYFDEVEELANGVMAVIQDEYGAILGMSLGVSEEELEGAIIELGLGDADAERLRNMRLYYGVVQTAAEAFVTLDGELFDTRYPGLRDPLTGEFNDDFKAFIESEGLPDLKGISVLAVAVDNDAPIEDLRAKAEEMKAIVGEDAEAYFMAKQAEVVADIRDKEDALEGIKEELMQTLVDAEAAALAAAIAAKKAELTAEVDQKIAEVDTAIAVLEGDKETATTDINKDIKDIEDDIAVKKSSLGLMVAGLEELKGEAGVKPETITDMEKLIEALEADIEALGETAALFSAMRLNATGPIQTDIDELKALRADYVGHRGDIEDADSLTRLEELEGMLFEKPEIGFDPAPTNGLDPRDDVDVEARQTQVDVLVDKANKEIDEAIERAELIAYFDEVEELANGVMAVIQDEYGAILGMSLGVSEEELEGAIIELGLGDADAERLRNMRLYYGVVQTAAEAFVTLDGELFDTRYPGLRDPLTGEFNDDFKAFIESEGLPDLKGISVLAVAVDNDAPIEDLRAKAEEMKAIVGEDAEAYFMAKQAEVVADIRDKEDALEGIKEELMQTLVDAEAAALAAALQEAKDALLAEIDVEIARLNEEKDKQEGMREDTKNEAIEADTGSVQSDYEDLKMLLDELVLASEADGVTHTTKAKVAEVEEAVNDVKIMIMAAIAAIEAEVDSGTDSRVQTMEDEISRLTLLKDSVNGAGDIASLPSLGLTSLASMKVAVQTGNLEGAIVDIVVLTNKISMLKMQVEAEIAIANMDPEETEKEFFETKGYSMNGANNGVPGYVQNPPTRTGASSFSARYDTNTDRNSPSTVDFVINLLEEESRDLSNGASISVRRQNKEAASSGVKIMTVIFVDALGNMVERVIDLSSSTTQYDFDLSDPNFVSTHVEKIILRLTGADLSEDADEAQLERRGELFVTYHGETTLEEFVPPLEGETFDENGLSAWPDDMKLDSSGITNEGTVPAYITLFGRPLDDGSRVFNYDVGTSAGAVAMVHAFRQNELGEADATRLLSFDDLLVIGLKNNGNGAAVRVKMVDADGRVAEYVLKVTDQMQNFVLDLTNPLHVEDGFDKDRVAMVNLEVDRELSPNRRGQIVFMFAGIEEEFETIRGKNSESTEAQRISSFILNAQYAVFGHFYSRIADETVVENGENVRRLSYRYNVSHSGEHDFGVAIFAEPGQTMTLDTGNLLNFEASAESVSGFSPDGEIDFMLTVWDKFNREVSLFLAIGEERQAYEVDLSQYEAEGFDFSEISKVEIKTNKSIEQDVEKQHARLDLWVKGIPANPVDMVVDNEG